METMFKAPLDESATPAGRMDAGALAGCPEAVAGEEPDGTWLRPIEVANYLKVSRSSVYQWIRRGDIPSKRIGSQIRVNRSVLESLIESDALAW